MAVHSNDMAFLETVLLEIIDDYGNMHEARALLDSGSMPNVMSTAMARQLTTTRRKVDMSVSGVGNLVQVVKGAVTATVRSKVRPYSTQMEFLVLDAPTSSIPTASIDVSAWCMPNVPLTDPAFSTPGKIDIVIGGDTYWELHSGQKRSLGKGKPWLVETLFGWVVAGISSIGMPQTSSACLLSTAEASLDSVMERFWQSENVAEEPVLSVEEYHCEQFYKATTTRNAAGRYVVQFPRSSDPSIFLGASKQIADRRLLAMERRLKSNSKMKLAYVEFMRDYERLGHMKKLSEPIDDSVRHYYVPLHAVVKESSTTTKVRVVFDASCKTTSGWSLNDMLLVGPVIQQDLYSIMLRFRSHPIALVADVEKMYRQVLHDASDRKLLRIRYREESSDPISTYELQTVTYGTASAPFLATRTLKQIALDYKDKYPLAANPVLNDFYVDDLLTRTRSVSQAVEMRQQISSMLESAGFILKKWASNIPNVLTGLPQEDLAIQPSHE